MASKILVVGSTESRFFVFEKISKLHSKNDFSFALILGDLFADASESSAEAEASLASLLEAQIKIPLTTYFTLGKNPLPLQVREKLEKSDGELCPNLYFLGKHSTTKTSEGLRIVTLGGSLNIEAEPSKDSYSPSYTEGDAKILYGANEVDILITSDWPASIRARSNVELTKVVGEQASEQQCVADLCLNLKPRYHFSTSSQCFYEREPFYYYVEKDQHISSPITRFISVASVGNISKEKWLYAFSIDSPAPPSLGLPDGSTPAPFTVTSLKKRQRLPDQEQSYSRFSTQDSDRLNYHRPYKRARHRQPPPGPRECFFCLSNQNLATHLITSIGNDSYLTTAKGPLSTAKSYPSMSFPAHILIIPLSHSPVLSGVTPPEVRSSTFNEMQRYRRSLQALVASISKGALGAVTWEASRAEGIHNHWQFLPVPTDLIRRGLVDAAFKVEAENEKYPGFKIKEIREGSSEKGDYFRVWVWQPQKGVEATLDTSEEGITEVEEEGGKELSMVMPLSTNFKFDLQFGRRVMAKLLGLEGRMHWRDCEQTFHEESKDAEAFKEAFQAYDFSLKEG